MAKITVDGVSFEVDPANNLLHECLSQGLDLPYFCWHPCLGSVGACRQCAVKQYRDADDETGTIVMACMTPAADGARLSIKDEQAVAFRAGVIESLMTSHPHDCPVCEEGGECHLQDMTQMSGHVSRRYDKLKVTHRNQDLGPFINHEMNRCITCYRCVRFYDDYAGGTDLAAQASHHHTYFGRFEDGTLESEFSGNLVEVCPTGVFTDRPFSAHYSRKWDLQTAPSVCSGCAVGCNITPGERYGSLRRVVNRYHDEINGYFICDRGRFGAHYVNAETRLLSAKDRAGLTLNTADAKSVLSKIVTSGAIGIGSPRASNEANFALRSLVGEENFYSGESDADHEAIEVLLESLRDAAFHCPSVREVESADAVFILGEDVTNTAPRLALALRQSVRGAASALAEQARIPAWQDAAVRELAQDASSPLALFATGSTRLDDIAATRLNAGPEDCLAAASALYTRLSGGSPDYAQGMSGATMQAVEEAAAALLAAKNPLILSGVGAGAEAMRLACNIARKLGELKSAPCSLALLPAENNSVGHGLMVSRANTLGAALRRLKSEASTAVIVAENDLFVRAPTAEVEQALGEARDCVVLDQLATRLTPFASLRLPSAAFHECESTRVNYEGRAQLSFQVSSPPELVLSTENWLVLGEPCSSDTLIRRCGEALPDFSELPECLPNRSSSIGTMVNGIKIPRQSHRASGRTAVNAARNVHEPKQPVDDNSVMAFSMEGVMPQRDATILGAAWAPGWNSNQSISKFQAEINGALKQGHAGSLLLRRTESGKPFAATPRSAQSEGLELHLVSQLFGSDELSAAAKSIQARMCDGYVGINKNEAARVGIEPGALVSVQGVESPLGVIVREETPDGVALVYPGSAATGLAVNRHDLPRSVKALVSVIETEELAQSRLGYEALVVSDRPRATPGEDGR